MKKKILVIDDDDTVRQTICDVLEASGYSVASAPDGDEGIRKHLDGQFDLVITDILMPNKEGIETIREIRQATPNSQIIAISGGDRTGNNIFLQMAEKLGASTTLPKPFTPDQLVKSVADIFEFSEPVDVGS